MKSLFRKMAKGQGGFTLVELLVVVAILGVIAAVAVLAVTKFIGKGTLEAAKTELHQAQTAIAACMSDAGSGTLTANNNTTGWDGSAGEVYCVAGSPAVTYDAHSYLHGTFKAFYTVDPNGDITGIGTSGYTWSGIHWDATVGNWVNN
jgi:prepilin-type N-terminal cleavage/methylation domain-containing protein